ncbi:hypothetical protein V6N13_016811 [Hibiscus sabdariffa]
MDHHAGSRESVNGEHGDEYRRVDGMEDVLKRDVLTTCAVVWCKGSLRGMELLAVLKREGFTGFSMMRISGAAYLLMFTNEEDMRNMVSRPAINQWFTKIEGWKPGVQIGSRSAWLSVVGIPIHLWSEGTFCSIAQVWGPLIRVEDAAAEPQSFERTRFLIETSCDDRIEETLKLFWGEESYRIRIQEVEVVHSHDLMCTCADSDTVVSSEDNQGAVEKLQLVRDNPTFAPVMLPSHVDVGGDVNCDEWLGLVDRNIEVIFDHVDVMWESQPEPEPPEWNTVKIRGEMVITKMEQLRGEPIAENQEQLLALEWVTQSGKDIEFSVSQTNLREESVQFTTALNYSDFDLVPVPISIVPTLEIPEVQEVVINGVARKVRSINEVTINTGSEEQRGVLFKARGSRRSGRIQKGWVAGESFVNCSLSDSDIQARQQVIRREAEATLQLGAVVGVETIGREEELISDLSRIISRHSKAH